MKVLHVGEYVKGGVATYLHTLFSDETSAVDNYLVLSQPMSDTNWEMLPSKVHYYSYKRRLLDIPLAMLRIWRVIRQVNPDILMVHSTWAGVFVRFPYLFIPKKKKKIIYNAHGWAFLRDTSAIYKKIYALIERLLSNVTDCIINVSDYEQNAALIYGLPREKMMRIYNGVDAPKSGVTVIGGLDPNKINLLFVGRFDRQKGLDWLLHHFQHDIKRRDVHLYIIGSSVIDNDTISITDEHVTFLGWVDRQKIDGYYRLCDALIMPSRWEAFGLTAVEAMRNGVPVIASRHGALPEIVRPEESGWLFDMDSDGSSLNEVLCSLNKNSMSAVGKQARKLYELNFTGIGMRRNIASLYERLYVTTLERK